MKLALKIGLLIVIVVAALVGLVVMVIWWERSRLYNPQSVTEEIGLTLPAGARITDTRAYTFSLVDGDNYAWLIECDSSLMAWIAQNMRREDGDGISWTRINSFNEISDFQRPEFATLKLHSVWRASKQGETSYLYLAEGEKIGVLETFRP